MATTHLVFLTEEIRHQISVPERPGKIRYVDASGSQTLCNTDVEGDLMVTHLDAEHVDCLRCTAEAQKRWFL